MILELQDISSFRVAPTPRYLFVFLELQDIFMCFISPLGVTVFTIGTIVTIVTVVTIVTIVTIFTIVTTTHV